MQAENCCNDITRVYDYYVYTNKKLNFQYYTFSLQLYYILYYVISYRILYYIILYYIILYYKSLKPTFLHNFFYYHLILLLVSA